MAKREESAYHSSSRGNLNTDYGMGRIPRAGKRNGGGERPVAPQARMVFLLVCSRLRSKRPISETSAIFIIHELLSENLPIMEREYFSRRYIAREKYNWCRRIELIQDLRHRLHATTIYKTAPARFCICRLHEWAFKTSYCEEYQN